MQLKHGSRPYKILKYLAFGANFLVISTVSPYGGALAIRGLIKEYFRKSRFEKYRFLTDLKNLQKSELIDYQDLGNGEVKITITKKGGQKALTYSIDEIKIKKPNRWDKKWRLVMFDIPQTLSFSASTNIDMLYDFCGRKMDISVFNALTKNIIQLVDLTSISNRIRIIVDQFRVNFYKRARDLYY